MCPACNTKLIVYHHSVFYAIICKSFIVVCFVMIDKCMGVWYSGFVMSAWELGFGMFSYQVIPGAMKIDGYTTSIEYIKASQYITYLV